MFEDFIECAELYLRKEIERAEIKEEIDLLEKDTKSFIFQAEEEGDMITSGLFAELLEEVKLLRGQICFENAYEPKVRRSLKKISEINETLEQMVESAEEYADVEADYEEIGDPFQVAEGLIEEIDEERLDTDYFISIIDLFEEYEGTTEDYEYALKYLDHLLEKLSRIVLQYDSIPLSDDHVSAEFIRADLIFRRGSSLWEEGLRDLKTYCDNMDYDFLERGMEKIEQGNQLLVAVQIMAEEAVQEPGEII